MNIKLLTEHHLEFLSFKGGCKGLSESIRVKMPHCWKSHVAAKFYSLRYQYDLLNFDTPYSVQVVRQLQLDKANSFVTEALCRLGDLSITN